MCVLCKRMFSKRSMKNTKKRRLIGVTLNLLTIKIFWISLKRNLVALLLYWMKLVCFLSTHEIFAQKLYQTFKNHKRFRKPKLSCTDFTICHYAGDVTYQTDLFFHKNKDYAVAEHQALLYASKCPFVLSLFLRSPEDSSKQSKLPSIGSRFKGVMEAIRISCAGYPTRKTFDEFGDRFGLLARKVLDGSIDEVAACKRILENVGLEGYQLICLLFRFKLHAEDNLLGKFMRVRTLDLPPNTPSIPLAPPSGLPKELYTSAVSIQTGMPGMAARCELRFRRQTRASIVIQSHCQKYLAQLYLMRLKKAAITTQCAWRGKVARHELRLLKMAARETVALQAAKNKLDKQVEDLILRLQLEKRLPVLLLTAC